MSGAASSQRLRNAPWMTYLSTALVALALKVHYSRATAGQLAWILQPTAAVVGWLTRQPFVLDDVQGWVASDGTFVIAPACAGVNFLIVLFTLLAVAFAPRFGVPLKRCVWLVIALCAAYVSTILVNSLRIIVAVALYGAEVHVGWFTVERVHRLAGTTMYLAGLWVVWLAADAFSAWLQDVPVSSRWARVLVPSVYLGMTVLVPLCNGAWRQFGAQYVEHAISVSLIALGGVRLLSIVRWATSWSTVTRKWHHGQTDNSRGRR